MPDETTRRENGAAAETPGGRGWLRRAAELLLLGWVLGLFAYFYQVRGYLALAREVLGL
ncbi:MAG: hypothetical protein WDA75_03290 [Candidatus Latescibacterota bacterium]|jgi:hypothetical protein